MQRLRLCPRRLATLPWARQRALLEALAIMPLVVSGLRRLGLKRTGRLLERLGAGSGAGRWETPTPDLVTLAWAARAAARRGPWSAACLAESLALWWMLRRRGLAAELRLGVILLAEEAEAHAWVELDGQPINETEDVTLRYRAFLIRGGG